MLQPIDQPSPVKAAAGVQKLPTCGQNQPAWSAHREQATQNFAPAGLGSSRSQEQERKELGAPGETPPHPLHALFSRERLQRKADQEGHYPPSHGADQQPQTRFRCKVT